MSTLDNSRTIFIDLDTELRISTIEERGRTVLQIEVGRDRTKVVRFTPEQIVKLAQSPFVAPMLRTL